MAKKKTKEEEFNKLVATCLSVIQEKQIVFISDLVAFLPFNRATFYNHGLDKLDTLKEAIEKNKINTKHELRRDWKTNKAPVLQIALYKLLATQEERQALNGQSNQADDKKEIGENLLNVLKQVADD